ncbi:terpene synthase family protein [Streptomyces sp. NPDC003032]
MTADPLKPYRTHLADQRQRELADALFTWSVQRCSCLNGASWHARRAFFAAAFEGHCAPADAVWWESLLAAKFIALYFILDDGPAEDAAQLASELTAAQTAPESELGTLYRALLTDMHAHDLDTCQLHADVAQLCLAVAAESHHDPAEMTPQEFHALRLVTVASLPYINCWRTIRALPAPDEDWLDEQALEAIYIANDLASLEKEQRPDATGAYVTSNCVLFHAARNSTGLPEAIDAAVARYNHLADGLTHSTPGPHLSLLTGVVDGNLRAHHLLAATRFPGAARHLHRLRFIRAYQSAHEPVHHSADGGRS